MQYGIFFDANQHKTRVKEPEKNTTILKFMDYYMNDLYKQRYHYNHPNLKKEQYERVYEVLYIYAKDFLFSDFKNVDNNPTDVDEYTYEMLIEMALMFFNKVKSDKTNWNINHFATEGILENRMYEIM